MYSYNAYIHSRIHIFFYVSSLIIRSISVCCVRVVMRMCLRQHDTTQSRGSQPKTCASVLTYAVQGLSYHIKVEKHKKSQHNPVPSKDLEVMLLDIPHQELDRKNRYSKRNHHSNDQYRQFHTCKCKPELQ